MFDTARRPDGPVPPFRWLHGTAIGMVEGLDAPQDEAGGSTHWAPEVVEEGLYHMVLSHTAGTPAEGGPGVPRVIAHLTSPDLLAWTRVGPLALPSPGVIDARAVRCPDGLWRLWCKDETRGTRRRDRPPGP